MISQSLTQRKKTAEHSFVLCLKVKTIFGHLGRVVRKPVNVNFSFLLPFLSSFLIFLTACVLRSLRLLKLNRTLKV